jgi:hypothetical protein
VHLTPIEQKGDTEYFMVEDQLSAGQKRQRAAHKLWLAMRAAHDRYQSASATLHELSDKAPDDPRFWDAGPLLDKAAEEQRTAFEAYIESRLEFSEFMLSAGDGALAMPKGFFARGKRLKSHLALLAVALVFPTVSLLSLLGRVQQHARQLDAIRDEVNQMTVTIAKQAPSSASQPGAKQLPGYTVLSSAEKRPGPPKQRQKDRRTRERRTVPAQVKGLVPGERKRTDFVLNRNRSKRFERVGPVRLLLRDLNSGKQSLDLSVLSDGGKVDINDVKLFEPVRIHLKGRPGNVVIIVDRMARNQVRGYLAISAPPLEKSS